MSLEKEYYTPSSSGSLGGVKRLQDKVGGKLKDVKRFLQGQKTYQLYKPRRVKFKRRKYQVSGIDDLWQSDLADLSKLKDENDGVTYLLIVIDVFSKFLWVRPLPNKTGSETLAAIEDIITRSGRKPTNMMTDKGTEFVNSESQDMYDRLHINFYTANNPETKSAVAERVIRTIKSRISRYITKTQSRRYIDVLQDIVTSYNNSKHRTIGMKPIGVTKKTETAVRQRAFLPTIYANPPKFNFKVGDRVRISIEQKTFGKGYFPQWTDELFVVARRLKTIPPTYKLKDEQGERIIGSFYEPELQYIPPNYQEPASPTTPPTPPPSPELGPVAPESPEL